MACMARRVSQPAVQSSLSPHFAPPAPPSWIKTLHDEQLPGVLARYKPDGGTAAVNQSLFVSQQIKDAPNVWRVVPTQCHEQPEVRRPLLWDLRSPPLPCKLAQVFTSQICCISWGRIPREQPTAMGGGKWGAVGKGDVKAEPSHGPTTDLNL